MQVQEKEAWNVDLRGANLRPLTASELCEYLRASKYTIDQYNREGMPRFFVGKEIRYIPEKVVAWLERRALPRVAQQETFDPRKELDK
jgi:hypothetical protein